MSDDWRPLATMPRAGVFLIAQYAPTNWAYHVTTKPFYEEDGERLRETKLRYAVAWRPMPEEPPAAWRSTR